MIVGINFWHQLLGIVPTFAYLQTLQHAYGYLPEERTNEEYIISVIEI